MASAVFVLHKKTDLISAPASCVHLIIIIFFVYFKILGISDPLLPIENVFKKIFLGGIFDTLQETFYGKPEESEEASKQGNEWDDFKDDLKYGCWICLWMNIFFILFQNLVKDSLNRTIN